MARPFRLDRNCYVGLHSYFVTVCTLDRHKAFLEQSLCLFARSELLAYAKCHRFAIATYCLMPDHAHLLLSAKCEDAKLTKMLAAWKQRTGFAWSRRISRRLWQKGYWDYTLRAEEEILSFARYIVENPVRAGLVRDPRDYPWTGSEEYSIQEILEAAQIDLRGRWRG